MTAAYEKILKTNIPLASMGLVADFEDAFERFVDDVVPNATPNPVLPRRSPSPNSDACTDKTKPGLNLLPSEATGEDNSKPGRVFGSPSNSDTDFSCSSPDVYGGLVDADDESSDELSDSDFLTSRGGDSPSTESSGQESSEFGGDNSSELPHTSPSLMKQGAQTEYLGRGWMPVVQAARSGARASGDLYGDSVHECYANLRINHTVIGRLHGWLRRLTLESSQLSENYTVLMAAIPRRGRSNVLNKVWDACVLYYTLMDSDFGSPHWKERPLQFIGDDECNGDRLFRAVIPKTRSPFAFFLKDQHSSDSDHPSATAVGDHERSMCLGGNYYQSTGPIVSLRDGEIRAGDRISMLGVAVTLLAERSHDAPDWRWGSKVYYMDTQDGTWHNAGLFDLNESQGGSTCDPCVEVIAHKFPGAKILGRAVVVGARGLSFVIRNAHTGRWINNALVPFANFYVPFPGYYVVTLGGTLTDITDDVSAQNSSDGYTAAYASSPKAPKVFQIGTPPRSTRSGSGVCDDPQI